MAWEERSNGKRYYYRKRWQSGRVISEYIGAGPFAELTDLVDTQLRAEQAHRRAEQQRAHADFMDLSRQVDRVNDQVRSLARTFLLSSGYYLHKGQFRRRHE